MFSHKSINFNKKLVAVREKTATLSHSIKRERHAGPQIFIVVRPQRAPSQASEVVVNSLCPSVNLPLFYLSTCRRTSSPISHRALSFEPRRVTFKWHVESDARLLLEFVADLLDTSRLCWKTETLGQIRFSEESPPLNAWDDYSQSSGVLLSGNNNLYSSSGTLQAHLLTIFIRSNNRLLAEEYSRFKKRGFKWWSPVGSGSNTFSNARGAVGNEADILTGLIPKSIRRRRLNQTDYFGDSLNDSIHVQLLSAREDTINLSFEFEFWTMNEPPRLHWHELPLVPPHVLTLVSNQSAHIQ